MQDASSCGTESRSQEGEAQVASLNVARKAMRHRFKHEGETTFFLLDVDQLTHRPC